MLARIKIREIKSGNKTERIPTVQFDEEALGQIDKLEEYEADYKQLVNECRNLLERATPDKLATYWKIADKIVAFRNKYDASGFMETLHLDLGISLRTIERFLKFRREYETFDSKISWSYYSELMNHLPKRYRKEFEKKLALGKIKNAHTLRAEIIAYRKEKKIKI